METNSARRRQDVRVGYSVLGGQLHLIDDWSNPFRSLHMAFSFCGMRVLASDRNHESQMCQGCRAKVMSLDNDRFKKKQTNFPEEVILRCLDILRTQKQEVKALAPVINLSEYRSRRG